MAYALDTCPEANGFIRVVRRPRREYNGPAARAIEGWRFL
jgi:hypothetical protein